MALNQDLERHLRAVVRNRHDARRENDDRLGFLPDLRGRTMNQWITFDGPIADATADFQQVSESVLPLHLFRSYEVPSRGEICWPLFLMGPIDQYLYRIDTGSDEGNRRRELSAAYRTPRYKELWQRFTRDVAYMTRGSVNDMDQDSYAVEAEMVARAALDYRTAWYNFIDEAVQYVAERLRLRDDPVFVLLFEEWEFRPQQRRQMIEAVRGLNHPRLFYIEAPTIFGHTGNTSTRTEFLGEDDSEVSSTANTRPLRAMPRVPPPPPPDPTAFSVILNNDAFDDE